MVCSREASSSTARTIRLDLEYDGTNYAGFQVQRGLPTIQGAIEEALRRLTGEAIRVHGAGRTDAGVHATGQVVSFRTQSKLPPDTFVQALNALLPDDIAVLRAADVSADFHARYSARGRVYRYSIWNRPTHKAIGRQYVYHYRVHLDDGAMREACRRLVGTHDFASFAGAPDPGHKLRSTVREVFYCTCERQGDLVVLEIAANAFLPHMVRNVVGTLIRVGTGAMTPDDVSEVLAARTRACAGPAAPARGLCLVQVWY